MNCRLFLGLASLIFYPGISQSAARSSPQKITTAENLNSAPLKHFSFGRQKRNSSFASLSESCKKQWITLASNPLGAVANDFKNGKILLNLECQASEEAMFQSPYVGIMYDSVCRDPERIGRARTQEEEVKCKNAFWIYRALIIDRLALISSVKDQPSVILFNKLVAAMFSDYVPRDRVFLHMKGLVEELIRQSPELYTAYQMRAYIYLPLLPGPNPPFDEFNRVLTACEAFHLKDSAVAEMRFGYFIHKKDIDGLIKIAKANILFMPEFGVGHYYLALAYWKKNNKQGAINELQEATKIEPQNERFRRTLALIEKAPLGEGGLFMQDISINFAQTF